MRRNTLDPSSSPLKAFGWQLRELRERAAMRQKDLGAAAGYTGAYVSMIENGLRLPPVEFVRAVDHALGAGGALEGTWWMLTHSAFIEGFDEYRALELTTVELCQWEVGLPPGIAQTRRFATALQAGYVERGSITQAQADARVQALMDRQAPLRGPNPPRLRLILDESCVRSVIGSPSVTAEQLGWLVELARRPNVTLQVLPFDRAGTRPFTQSVTLLTLPTRETVGYTETHHRGYVQRESATVAAWLTDYHRLQAEALAPDESIALIHTVRKGLVNMSATPQIDRASATWFKASYSNGQGQCVEISTDFVSSHATLLVRDSKDPDGPALSFSPSAWAAFAEAAGNGKFGDA
ncbi:Scr1 family TA system antitoxin-like transcriptional regulator [Kitasatospora sp. CB01950]|uniref:Scr1 family TA system antitoxin-like transcriptional regulator n=1 Tax=Kitasatospora sp. CB01950 TaxID=1703930 RepID=UPI000940433E|nr:Scr1 family TA system antitoxin-like transcriptional regulator [Kitasatospora sp. CB01950]